MLSCSNSEASGKSRAGPPCMLQTHSEAYGFFLLLLQFRTQSRLLQPPPIIVICALTSHGHLLSQSFPFFFFLKILFIYFYRGERSEKERERDINVWLPLTYPITGDLAHNLGMCPTLGIEPETFSLQASTQSTEPHQLGP